MEGSKAEPEVAELMVDRVGPTRYGLPRAEETAYDRAFMEELGVAHMVAWLRRDQRTFRHAGAVTT